MKQFLAERLAYAGGYALGGAPQSRSEDCPFNSGAEAQLRHAWLNGFSDGRTGRAKD